MELAPVFGLFALVFVIPSALCTVFVFKYLNLFPFNMHPLVLSAQAKKLKEYHHLPPPVDTLKCA